MSEVTISKESTFEEKVSFLRTNIVNKDSEDTLAIRNIFCLISTQSLTDELFNDPTVIFKDIEEFSDVKTELVTEIKELKSAIALAYLSVITSCRAINSITNGQLQELPNMYAVLMGNLGFFALNSFLFKYLPELDLSKVYVVPNAIQTMSIIAQPLTVLNNVVTTVMGGK